VVGLDLTTHEGHFMGAGHNRLLLFTHEGRAWVRAAGTWDPMPWHLEQAYRRAGSDAQHAFWGWATWKPRACSTSSRAGCGGPRARRPASRGPPGPSTGSTPTPSPDRPEARILTTIDPGRRTRAASSAPGRRVLAVFVAAHGAAHLAGTGDVFSRASERRSADSLAVAIGLGLLGVAWRAGALRSPERTAR
jgi:hypothetical protein